MMPERPPEQLHPIVRPKLPRMPPLDPLASSPCGLPASPHVTNWVPPHIFAEEERHSRPMPSVEGPDPAHTEPRPALLSTGNRYRVTTPHWRAQNGRWCSNEPQRPRANRP